MTDAFIFDHVRTPRGRGKPDGSLHTATTLRLAATALKAIKDRNHLDPLQVDDVVMGCVDPVGEAGSDIARMGALAAGFGDTVPGVQINRFCASGLDSVNFAAAQVMSGQHDLTIGSLDAPSAVAPGIQYGVESKLAWLDSISTLPLRDIKAFVGPDADVGSRQHPDHDT